MAIIWITLTPDDIRWASMVGTERRLNGLNRKLVELYGVPKHPWDAEIDGAAGESAMCKYMGRTWGGGLIIGAPDCGLVAPLGSGQGPAIQVRTTHHLNGCLMLHKELGLDGLPKDKDEDFFVLVLVKNIFEYGLAGYIRGRDGKQLKYWKDKNTRPAFDPPAYGVEQKFLIPLPAKPRKFGAEPGQDAPRTGADGEGQRGQLGR